MKKAMTPRKRGGKKASIAKNGRFGRKARILCERHINGLALAKSILIELSEVSFDCERIDDIIEALRAINASRRHIESFR